MKQTNWPPHAASNVHAPCDHGGDALSELTRNIADQAAEVVAQEHVSICLTREEQIALISAILNPPEPGERLHQAAKRYCRKAAVK